MAEGGAMPYWTSDLTDRGICHLPFEASTNVSEDEIIAKTQDVLQHLQFVVSVNQKDKSGFKVNCYLLWKGEINNEIIKKIEMQKYDLNWEILVAWKAMGESAYNYDKVKINQKGD
jgi:hypothetical protein